MPPPPRDDTPPPPRDNTPPLPRDDTPPPPRDDTPPPPRDGHASPRRVTTHLPQLPDDTPPPPRDDTPPPPRNDTPPPPRDDTPPPLPDDTRPPPRDDTPPPPGDDTPTPPPDDAPPLPPDDTPAPPPEDTPPPPPDKPADRRTRPSSRRQRSDGEAEAGAEGEGSGEYLNEVAAFDEILKAKARELAERFDKKVDVRLPSTTPNCGDFRRKFNANRAPGQKIRPPELQRLLKEAPEGEEVGDEAEQCSGVAGRPPPSRGGLKARSKLSIGARGAVAFFTIGRSSVNDTISIPWSPAPPRPSITSLKSCAPHLNSSPSGFDNWTCNKDEVGVDLSYQTLRRECTMMISDGLERKINKKVNMRGWPDTIDFMCPSNLGTMERLRPLYEALMAGSCRWQPISVERKKELQEAVAAKGPKARRIASTRERVGRRRSRRERKRKEEEKAAGGGGQKKQSGKRKRSPTEVDEEEDEESEPVAKKAKAKSSSKSLLEEEGLDQAAPQVPHAAFFNEYEEEDEEEE
ncbi:hypothetical protein C8F04DRAFT_1201691 [Mycena alexandri]|uniref:Uncharacterized protein n=1 Tax=Mycena alexandri TaxID=1745969 RepID=A0AAD6RWF8_9AGAR|nr:hypothetical protein C8F04DRAFT_1201691 [Mycena alexandri]